MLVAVALAIRSILPLHPHAEPINSRQTLCLAQAIYHESRGEPYAGQVLVAETILNRAHRSHNGDICETLAVRGQFPWWKHRNRMPVTEEAAFTRSAELAVNVQSGTYVPSAFAVYYFFGKTEWPYFRWANTRRTIRIGTHIFLPLQKPSDKF
jgi:spore germination cell wall hydrolase CwlJ-like protein